jgi:hypothetical protein
VVISIDRHFGATGLSDVGTSPTVRAFTAISYRFLVPCADLTEESGHLSAIGRMSAAMRGESSAPPGAGVDQLTGC